MAFLEGYIIGALLALVCVDRLRRRYRSAQLRKAIHKLWIARARRALDNVNWWDRKQTELLFTHTPRSEEFQHAHRMLVRWSWVEYKCLAYAKKFE